MTTAERPSGANDSNRRSLRREAIAVVASALTLGAFFCLPVLRNLGVVGVREDWDFSMDLDWVPYFTVVHFHQFPLWNPCKCGGMPMLGNPQSRIISPFFLLHLIAGAVVGLQLEVPLHFALAWAGGYVLGRVLKMSRMAAAGTATMFPAASWFWLHVSVGHIALAFGFAWLPWAVALAVLAADRHRASYAVLSGAALAMTFLEGMPYPTVYTALVLVCVLTLLAVFRLSPWPLIALVATGFFAAALAAPKLFPAYRMLATYPRPIGNAGQNPYELLLPLLFSRWQDVMRPGLNGWGFWESGAYIGLFALPTALGTLYLKRAIPWIVVAVGAAMLFRGDANTALRHAFPGDLAVGAAMLFRGDTTPGAFSLWVWLHQWPVFASMRVPSRSIIAMVFAFSVLAGFGLDLMRRYLGRFGPYVGAAILAIATIDCTLVGTWNLKYPFENRITQVPVFAPQFRQNEVPAHGHQLEINLRNEGAVRCYDYEDWATRAAGFGDSRYRGEQYLLGSGEVKLVRWSPNTLVFDVEARGSAVLVINQNFDSFWRVVQGQGEMVPDDMLWRPVLGAGEVVPYGLLAVWLPAGRQRLVLEYCDAAAMLGLAVFAFGVLFGLALWGIERTVAAGLLRSPDRNSLLARENSLLGENNSRFG